MSAIAIRLQFSYYHTQGVPLPQLTLQRRLPDLSAIAVRRHFHPEHIRCSASAIHFAEEAA